MTPRAQFGFALVLVLWALVLLTTIGVSFGFAVRVETGSGTALADQVQAEAIATAGVRRAILGLIAEDNELRWKSDGRTYKIVWPDADLHVTIRAESGKIDLNAASPQLLIGLFENLFSEADAEALTGAVVDWRDRDDRLSENGAEVEEYEAAGRSGPANARFTSVAELSQVMGFNGAMTEIATPYLTVYSKQPRVNVLSAGVGVLAAIPDISYEMAEQFVIQREADLAAEQTPDVTAFKASRRFVATRQTASVVEIKANAVLSGGASATVEAVINTRAGDQAYETLNWRTPMPPPVVDNNE